MNLSGDDYHKYDRGKKIWDRVTHLNPSANHLDMFADDVARFARGVAVKKRSYDHKTGILSREATIKPSDFNLISGFTRVCAATSAWGVRPKDFPRYG